MSRVLLHDVRTAVAALRAGGWSTVSAAGTLALGVGACLAAGVLAYGGLLRPLPVADERALMTVTQVYAPSGIRTGVRWNQFRDWRDRLAGVASLAAAARERATVRVTGRDPVEAHVAYVSDEWFQVAGITAARGRLPDADAPPNAAVVSEAFARRGDRAFTVAGRPYDVIGVVPASYAALDGSEVWLLARTAPPQALTPGDDSRDYHLLARLHAGVGVSALNAAARAVQQDVQPENQRPNWRIASRPFRDEVVGDARPALRALLLAAALILGLTCANVGLVLVNRVIARQREHAVRLALGAEPGRLARVVLLEGALIAVAGASAGGWIAWALTGIVASTAGLDVPAVATVDLTMPIVLGTTTLCVLVAAAVSAAPLLAGRRMPGATTLRPRSTIGSPAGAALRSVLVATQVATAVVLVTGALLLGRTVLALSRADVGLVDTSRAVTAAVPIGEAAGTPADRLATVTRLLDDVRALPGITAAGLGAARPPKDGGVVFTVRVASDSTVATRAFDLVPVTHGYLDALGVRLLAGRGLTEADMTGPPVAVMSVSAVRHLALVLDTALGRELPLMLPSATGTRVKARIVGIVDDIRFTGLDAEARGGVFVPWTQLPLGRAFVVARVAGGALPAAALARTIREADPTMPASPVRPLDDVLAEALNARTARFAAVALFAVVAVALATLALAGAMVRSVVERQRELAVRAAVGATPATLVRATWLRGLRLAVPGIAVGIAASIAFGRIASALLWGVSPTDPATYGMTGAGALVTACIASYVPARRAAAADPASLLASE